MTDSENFLSRWARRKRDAAKPEDKTEEIPPVGAESAEAARSESEGPPARTSESPPVASERQDQAPDEPPFDLSKLPSIESITADTDIRPFLLRGVPAPLRQAALRRAWVADPKIRDFIEMAENQWDFTGASEIPGFDFSPPTGDVKRMLADILSRSPEEDPGKESQSDAQSKSTPAAPAAEIASAQTDSHIPVTENSPSTENNDETAKPLAAPHEMESVRRTQIAEPQQDDAAPQKNAALQDSSFESRRPSHGRAMPK